MWSKFKIIPEKVYYWRAGSKEILVCRETQEWNFAERSLEKTHLTKTGFLEAPFNVDSLEWHSVIGDNNAYLHTIPAFPDRPIVIKATSPFKLLPKKETLLYIKVPFYIQFLSEPDDRNSLLFETSFQDYSSTWFGDPDKGEIAYSLPLNLSEAIRKPQGFEGVIVCPVKLINLAKTSLNIQRLLIRVNYLTIYQSEDQLWSNEVRIEFKGETETSNLSYAKDKPNFVSDAIQIASSRETKPNMISKSFHFIKSLNN
jgi:hypothetical protein